MDNAKFDLLNNQNEREIIMNEERLDVLDKVKQITTLGDSNYCTVEQVAEYYEVGKSAITSLVFDNKNELISNGFEVIKADKLIENHVISFKEFTKNRANYKFILNDGTILSLGGKGIALFTKRTILNVGMLLRDSDVAKEVRTLLLDNHEQLNNIHDKLENGEEITKEDIDKSDPLYFENREKELKQQELEIAQRLAKAIINGDMTSCMSINCEINKIKDDLVDLEKERNDLLVHSNKTYTASELATEFGFKSAIAFNNDLKERKIQYKVNGTWKLYSKYDGKGYTETKQTEINGTTIYNTRWTGEGRKFLLENVYNKNKTA